MIVQDFYFVLPTGVNVKDSGILDPIKLQIVRKVSHPAVISADLRFQGISIKNNELTIMNVFNNSVPAYDAEFLSYAQDIKNLCTSLNGTVQRDEYVISDLTEIPGFDTFTQIEVVNGTIVTDLLSI